MPPNALSEIGTGALKAMAVAVTVEANTSSNMSAGLRFIVVITSVLGFWYRN